MSTIYDTGRLAIGASFATGNISLQPGEDYVVGVAGNFGSGSLTFAFVAGQDHPVPIPGSSDGAASPLTLTAAGSFRVTALTPLLKVTGTTVGAAASAEVIVTRVNNR